MIVCAVRLELVAVCREGGGESLRVQDDLLSVRTESGLGDLKECGGDGSNGLKSKHMRKINELSRDKRTLL